MGQRIGYIDNAKGILILLMVVGHVLLDDVLPAVTEWIYVFHMPAFFIINGMLFHSSKTLSKPLGAVLFQYIYTILIPLAFSEVVGALHYIVRYGFTQSIFGFVYNTLHYHFNNGPDWFFAVLFVADMLFVLIQKVFNKKSKRKLLSACILLIAFMLPEELFILRSIGISFGCICIGYYFYNMFTRNKSVAVTIGIFIATWGVLYINGSVSLNVARVNNPFLWILGAVCGTVLMIQLGKQVPEGWITYLGKNSIIVMITHQAILLPLRYYTRVAEFDFLTAIVVLVLTVVLQFPLIYLINRYLPFCVGRKMECVKWRKA